MASNGGNNNLQKRNLQRLLPISNLKNECSNNKSCSSEQVPSNPNEAQKPHQKCAGTKEVKSGTVNEGYEYEKLVPAYFALKLLLDDTVKFFDFQLNSRSFRKFDDLIITVVKQDDVKEKFAIQLKHRDEEHKKVDANKEFNKVKSNFKQKGFNLSQFLTSYKKEKPDIQQSYKFLLFTNVEFLGIENVDNYEVRHSEKPFKTKLFNVGSIYQFKEQDAEFCENFFLISAQMGVKEMQDAVINMFSEIFNAEEQSAISYINFFQEVHNTHYDDNKLTRDAVVLNIINFLFSHYFIAPQITNKSDTKIQLIEDAIKLFDLTLLPDVSSDYVKNSFKYIVFKPNESDIKIIRALKLLKKSQELPKKLPPLLVAVLMQKPLFVEVTEKNRFVLCTVVQLLKTVEYQKLNVVLVGGKVERYLFQNWSVLETLEDLKTSTEIYENITKNFQISLQGREAKYIEDLQACVNLDEVLTASEIFYFLQDEVLLVGKKLENLPEFFIARKLKRSEVTLDQLKILCAKSTTIIHCQGQAKEFRQNLQNRGFDLDLLEPRLILTDDNFARDGCHHLVLNNEILEWSDKNVSADTLSVVDNNINLLSGSTGVGKTTMMKYLAKSCPDSHWVIRVVLQQMSSVFRKETDIDTILTQILSSSTTHNSYDWRICDHFRKHQKVLFLFDGLNEVNSSAIEETVDIIQIIAQRGYKIWISGTRNLPEFIAGRVKLFHSYTVEDISLDDQKKYVKNRLRSAHVSEHNIEKITQKLFGVEKKLEDILKLPLILYILTANFSRIQNVINLEKATTLYQMYATFVEGQIQHNLEKSKLNTLNNANIINVIIEGFKNYYINGYQAAALQTCLEPRLFVKLKIRVDKEFLKSIKCHGDILRFVQVNDNETFTFSHRTFAEYFAAMWFSDNFSELQLEEQSCLFKPEYEGIRRFFDAKLAQDCPLHLAVLENNIAGVRHWIKKLGDRDKKGRTPLHLAVSLWRTHELLEGDQPKSGHHYDNSKKQTEIVQELLNHGANPFKKDYLFGWNCFEYAAAFLCLSSLEEMSNYHPLHWKYIETIPLFTLSYYSVVTPYKNLLCVLINHQPLPLLEEQIKDSSLLNLALGSNRKAVAMLLLEKGANLTKCDSQKQTPLHKAATWGHTDIIKLLLDKSVNFEAKDSVGRTALQLAAKLGHKEIVCLLVKKGANIDAQDDDSKTALQRAACNGRTEIVKYLLANGANINAYNMDRKNSLHRAAEMGHYKTVEFLVKNGIDKTTTDKYKRSALHFSAGGGHEQVVKYLLSEDFDVFAKDEDEKTAKDLAEGRGYSSIVTILGAAENQRIPRTLSQHALFDAAKNGDLNELIKRITNGANINEVNHDGETILHVAAAKGHFDIVKFLLDNKANTATTDNLGRVPLHHACLGGNVLIVKELLNRGQDTATDDIGLIPLHRAAFKGHLEVVKLLITNGADPNARSSQGLTSLHSASLGGRNEVIKYLISVGANIEAKNCKEETCLHIAVLEGWPDTVDFLVRSQKKIIDEVDASGMTALYFAAQKGYKRMVLSLVQGEADVNITDGLKKTALDAAKDAGHIDIFNILQNHAEKL